MKNLILWIVIAVSLYTALYLIHKRALEKSVFRQLYEYYKGEKERRIAQEAGFIAKYGEIENTSLLYRADRMILQSGLKKGFRPDRESNGRGILGKTRRNEHESI